MFNLGEILEQVSRPESVDQMKEYRLLGIRLDGAGAFHRETKPGSQISTDTVFKVKAGDFIYSKLFAWRGAFDVIDTLLDSCYVSNEFPIFLPKTNKVDTEFLRLWFRLPETLAKVEALCSSSTPLTRNRLKEEKFLGLEIPLPPFEEQRRIVARIEEVAAKIEEVRGVQQAAKEEGDTLIKAIVKKLFCDLDSCIETTLENVCDSIIDNLHSNPVYADSGVACVRSPEVGWGKLHLHSALKTTEEEYVRRTVRCEPKVDDIVFVREGGGTGKVAIVEEGQRFSLGQRVMMFRLNKEKVIPRFFLYQMLSPLIYEKQIVPQCKGSASPHINIGVLRNFSFLLPSLDKQQSLIQEIDDLLLKTDFIGNKRKEIDIELDALLPSILDKAFKGEL